MGGLVGSSGRLALGRLCLLGLHELEVLAHSVFITGKNVLNSVRQFS